MQPWLYLPCCAFGARLRRCQHLGEKGQARCWLPVNSELANGTVFRDGTVFGVVCAGKESRQLWGGFLIWRQTLAQLAVEFGYDQNISIPSTNAVARCSFLHSLLRARSAALTKLAMAGVPWFPFDQEHAHVYPSKHTTCRKLP